MTAPIKAKPRCPLCKGSGFVTASGWNSACDCILNQVEPSLACDESAPLVDRLWRDAYRYMGDPVSRILREAARALEHKEKAT